MDFREFEKRIVKIKKMLLPGEKVQLAMIPKNRIQHQLQAIKTMTNPKRAAVLVLFYPSLEMNTRFVLILRKTYRGIHSAQVSLPGGKVELEDNSLQDTALREAQEEVGVNPEKIEIIKQLTEVYIPPSDFFVQPFVGITSQTPTFIPDDIEVDAIIEVDLEKFMDDKCIETRSVSASYSPVIEVPGFVFSNHLVWGATAMMLNEVRELLKKLY